MISAASLAIVMALCFVGTFCPRRYYDDNLLQRIGLAGIAVGCGPRLSLLLERHSFDGTGFQPMFQVFVHVGLAAFAIGTALKAWQHRPKIPPAPPPGRIVYHWADFER